jgi:hypothetical protein
MRFTVVAVCLALPGAACLFFAGACGPYRARSPIVVPPPLCDEWPADWAAMVGQTVTLEGRAADAKQGALLVGEKGAVWIDGLDAWPAGYYRGGDDGVRLRVTGKVISRDDVPVVVQRPGELPMQGIPVASEEEAKRQRRRYLLAEAKWLPLE